MLEAKYGNGGYFYDEDSDDYDEDSYGSSSAGGSGKATSAAAAAKKQKRKRKRKPDEYYDTEDGFVDDSELVELQRRRDESDSLATKHDGGGLGPIHLKVGGRLLLEGRHINPQPSTLKFLARIKRVTPTFNADPAVDPPGDHF